jgi:hypothetical protein
VCNEGLLPSPQTTPSHYVPELSGTSLKGVLIPFTVAPPSWPNYFLNASSESLRLGATFQHMHWGTHKCWDIPGSLSVHLSSSPTMASLHWVIWLGDSGLSTTTYLLCRRLLCFQMALQVAPEPSKHLSGWSGPMAWPSSFCGIPEDSTAFKRVACSLWSPYGFPWNWSKAPVLANSSHWGLLWPIRVGNRISLQEPSPRMRWQQSPCP